jgi:hypothetical protein
MNSIRFGLLSRTSAVLMLGLAASAAQATPRCETQDYPFDRIACAKAKEGPDALRRYIDRTRSLYMLSFWDYMSESELDRHHMQRRAQVQAPASVTTVSAVSAVER